MNWRKEPGAFRATPYVVLMTGPTWTARLSRTGMYPLHLGTFSSAREAMAACMGHKKAQEEEGAGWGEK